MTEDVSQVRWFLEGYIDNSKEFKRWRVHPLPYNVGRNLDSDLCLPFATISGQHAQLYMNGSDLQVRDLGSTNGTFLNRTRVREGTSLSDGDVLHFAEYEFRVSRWDAEMMNSSRTIFSNVSSGDLSEQLVIGVREFHEMLESHAVVPFFQPIVQIIDGEKIGYEVLVRGDQQGLDLLPTELLCSGDSFCRLRRISLKIESLASRSSFSMRRLNGLGVLEDGEGRLPSFREPASRRCRYR